MKLEWIKDIDLKLQRSIKRIEEAPFEEWFRTGERSLAYSDMRLDHQPRALITRAYLYAESVT